VSLQGIDFATLSLCDALDLAILIEEEATDRYDEFVHQMEVHHTPEAAQFFRFMSDNEAKHASQLVERRLQRFENAPSNVERSMLFDIEAPEYDQAQAFMTPRQAMQAALRAEEKAHAFFVAALQHVGDAQVQVLFEELRDEEIQHQNLVQRELAKLPPDSELTADDFGDEPMAQ
jgi:rubrerythrin